MKSIHIEQYINTTLFFSYLKGKIKLITKNLGFSGILFFPEGISSPQGIYQAEKGEPNEKTMKLIENEVELKLKMLLNLFDL